MTVDCSCSETGRRSENNNQAPRIRSCSRNEQLKVSIIVPLYNADRYIEECLGSILRQTNISLRSIDVVVYDDGSTDYSYIKVTELLPALGKSLGRVVLISGAGPTGVGSARNRACEYAVGSVLVFLDADDILNQSRVHRNMEAVQANPGAIIGSNFERIPKEATPRYTQYHRELATQDLEFFAFRDAPLAMPTIACHRQVYEQIGGFREGRGIPEDLYFCYDHMQRGGKLIKLGGEALVKYRYHESMTSHSLHRKALLQVRTTAFEKIVLPRWKSFAIWGAGRDGKDFYKALSERGRRKVREFLDIDPRKLGTRKLYGKDVLHFTNAVAPLVTCVALNRTGGDFESNLASLDLVIGRDVIPMV